MNFNQTFSRMTQAFLSPADTATADLLSEKWNDLPNQFQTSQQMYGRNEEGCGATVGVMPVCNFACKACYLGGMANKTPIESISSIEKQLIELRKHIGRWGNLQITDGEVTLREESELHKIIKLAIKHEMIPMIMTHGDTFKHDPELLYRLVKESGLREVSIHIDTTQRGRKGSKYKYAKSEKELMPLRDEFAELIRSVKKNTGYTLRAASTVTITKDNIEEVPSIIRWFTDNSDAFRLVSFQPVADVGRTVDEVANAVGVESLWEKIEEGLGQSAYEKNLAEKSHWWMGHSECSRFIFGYVFKTTDNENVFHRLTTTPKDIAKNTILEFYKKWPGLTFRADTPMVAIARGLGMIRQSLPLMLFRLPRLYFKIIKTVAPQHPWKMILNILRNPKTMNRLTIASHHFMSERELETTLGKERLSACSFKVVHEGELVSMCEYNALGSRDNYYQSLRKKKQIGAKTAL